MVRHPGIALQLELSSLTAFFSLAQSNTATDGGHTHFRNTGVHIAPKPGDALFFSYVDPVTLQMDNLLTLHSGCPVYEGDKKIVTQWIRLGVDEEHPYNSFGLY